MEILIGLLCIAIFIHYMKNKKKNERTTEQFNQTIHGQFKTKKVVQSAQHNKAHTRKYSTTNNDNALTEFEINSTDHQYEQIQSTNQQLPDDEDNELLEFELNLHKHSNHATKNKSQGVFKLPGDTVHIGEHTITGGLFYFGGWLPKIKSQYSYFHSKTEPSLIDDSLPINHEAIDYEDESLDYWPQFNSLSPSCRGAYIKWLASERDYPKTPIGYVFIYFYGLERRVLVDFAKGDVTDEELQLIYDEICRLKNVYQANRSFNSYSTRLIECIAILAPHIIPIEDNIEANHHSLTFKYYLATIVNSGLPISPDLAYIWLKASQNYTFRTPARRCPEEFEQLFKLKYQNKYFNEAKGQQGLIVKPNKTRLTLDYHPASSSLHGIAFTNFDLPNPSILTGPVNKFIAIADQCTDLLDSYSRYLGRAGNSRDDIAGLLHLPSELFGVENSPLLNGFVTWAQNIIEQQQGLISISELWQNIDLLPPEKINKKELELLTQLCQRASIGFAPDPRFHQVKPSPDGKIVLFSQGHGEYFEPSGNFNDTCIVLRLGAMMANADNDINEQELSILERLIDHDSQLSPTEKKSLHAYLIWRLNTPINMAGLKTKLAQVSNEEKQAVSHILVSIALADGTVEPSEIKQLEKLYTALGLDKAMVSSDIHQISTSRKPTSTRTTTSSNFDLDKDLLKIHQSETAQVQSMLGKIFDDEQPIEEELPKDNSPQQSNQYPGLTTNHQALLDTLLDKDQWSRAEVQALCDQFGLMVDGAIEVINDWAFDQVDDALIENDGDIIIDREIAIDLTEHLAGAV